MVIFARQLMARGMVSPLTGPVPVQPTLPYLNTGAIQNSAGFDSWMRKDMDGVFPGNFATGCWGMWPSMPQGCRGHAVVASGRGIIVLHGQRTWDILEYDTIEHLWRTMHYADH